LSFIFEYAPSNLADSIRDRRMTPVEILRISRDVADGLLYLHTRSPPIIHRDLKPENILLSEKKRAMLCDFGISREEKATAVMTSCGTPSYMPPEVFQEDTYTTKADVYSFGMLLYAMLAGHPPWGDPDNKTKNKFLIMKKVAGGARPPIPLAPEFRNKNSGILYEALAGLMEDCWQGKADIRPDVSGIVETLHECGAKWDEEVKCLEDMGFSRTDSQEALVEANNNMNLAASKLLEKKR